MQIKFRFVEFDEYISTNKVYNLKKLMYSTSMDDTIIPVPVLNGESFYKKLE